MTSFVLAIDIGTTSTKVLAVLPDGQVLKSDQSFYPTRYPFPGYAEQDPWQLLHAVKHSILKVLRDIPPGFALAAGSLSSAMHSFMAVDASGNPITPLLLWADTRSSKQAKRIRNTAFGHRLHEQTGTAIHPMSPFCKLLWFKEHQPELLQRAFKFISFKEFVVHHLCGEYLVDYSIASATGLFDFRQLSWSNEALTLLGIGSDKLSRPVPTDYRVYLKSGEADSFPSWKDAPLFLGASDGCLAQLGSDAMQQDAMTITLGTSGAVRRVAPLELKDPGRKLFRYLLYADTMIAGGATNNGTVVLDWFAREFETSDTDLTQVVRNASQVPPGCDGLIALPFLLGERAPIYNPEARGVFFNVSPRHTRNHFARALMEGICFEIKTIVESVEEVCGSAQRVLVSGGFTHAPEWVQLLSDVLDKNLIVTGAHDASAMGAARLAFTALNVPFKNIFPQGKTYLPKQPMSKLYTDQFGRFKRLYTCLEEQFGEN